MRGDNLNYPFFLEARNVYIRSYEKADLIFIFILLF